MTHDKEIEALVEAGEARNGPETYCSKCNGLGEILNTDPFDERNYRCCGTGYHEEVSDSVLLEDAEDCLSDYGISTLGKIFIRILIDRHEENVNARPALKALLAENKRLKGIIASAAWCLLAEENGAIVDTIWMPQGYGGLCGMTLYDNLTCELRDIEFQGVPEEDAESLKSYAYQALNPSEEE